MTTSEKPIPLNEMKTAQPDSDDPSYLAYVEKKIERGQNDLEHGRTLSEEVVWKALGVES